MSWRSRWGLWRSRAIYYWKPGSARAMRRFYGAFIGPGDLCFDIGSHLGNRIAVWRKLGARVVAAEPSPDCQRLLQRWYGRDAGVVLLSCAIGAETGSAWLHVNETSPTISTLRETDWQERMARLSSRQESWNRALEVPVKTLDQLIAEHGIPQFCKLDVEGFEEQVVAGLSVPIPHLSFEFINPGLEGVHGILDKLERLGPYRYRYALRERQRFNTGGDLSRETLTEHLHRLGQRVISGDIYARLP